jgi:multidrug transporter EmrE-like cation transporter
MSNFGIVLTVLAALMTTAANLCLRKGLAQSSKSMVGIQRLISLLNDSVFVVGILLYGLAMLPWLKVVSMEPVASAYPVLVGLTFVLLLIGAALFINEPISLKKIIGTFLILAGITIVARS